MASVFFKGMLIALVFGLPAGAIGVLCVQRTIAKGFWNGFVTGLASSICDVLYASAGIFGLSFVSSFLQEHDFIIRLSGSVLIFAFGLFTFVKTIKRFVSTKKSDCQTIFLKEKKENMDAVNASSLAVSFLSSFSIALLNPATFLSFIVIFSTFKVAVTSSFEGCFFIIGIFLGTAIWWFTISFLASKLKKRMNEKFFLWINLVCGILMILFAAACWWRK